MLHHVCAIPHRSSRVTSFRRFVGAMSGGGRWPRMPGLVRQWRLGRGGSTQWAARSDAHNWLITEKSKPQCHCYPNKCSICALYNPCTSKATVT